MTAPLIAIPTYHLGAGRVRNWEGAYALPESYVAALGAAGARTSLLPHSQPARYGAADHPEQHGIDPDRDQLELELARAAVRTGLPTLGICRGVQLLNVAFGGTLVQHLPELDGPAEPQVEHRNEANQAIHNLRVEPDSRLAEAIGQLEAEGLSHHHQGLDRLGDGFRPVAWAPDGLVEGIERDQGWTVGVLWHPESTAAADPVQHRLLRAFVEVASRRGQPFWRQRREPVGFGGSGSAAG